MTRLSKRLSRRQDFLQDFQEDKTFNKTFTIYLFKINAAILIIKSLKKSKSIFVILGNFILRFFWTIM